MSNIDITPEYVGVRAKVIDHDGEPKDLVIAFRNPTSLHGTVFNYHGGLRVDKITELRVKGSDGATLEVGRIGVLGRWGVDRSPARIIENKYDLLKTIAEAGFPEPKVVKQGFLSGAMSSLAKLAHH